MFDNIKSEYQLQDEEQFLKELSLYAAQGLWNYMQDLKKIPYQQVPEDLKCGCMTLLEKTEGSQDAEVNWQPIIE